MPNVDYAAVFKEANGELARSNFYYYGCDRNFHNLPKHSIDGHCQAYTCAITVDYFGVLPCSCDSAGSSGPACDKFNGQCSCKFNMMNRECNMCKPGSWGFGLSPHGCQRNYIYSIFILQYFLFMATYFFFSLSSMQLQFNRRHQLQL